MKIAIVGAGWSGLAAASTAIDAGHQVTVFESAQTLGGRARALPCRLPDGWSINVDNGQHILIGAYSETLRLMQHVGIDTETSMLRLPLTLLFADGSGLRLPRWPAPLDALAGILFASGWSMADKASLIRAALVWQWRGFTCPATSTVAELCSSISARVMAMLIEPLCVSALNTPSERASGQVFLRVLQDSLFGGHGSSNLLLPRTDLTQLFPQAAAHWVQQRGGVVRTGARVDSIAHTGKDWALDGERFDAVVWATASTVAAQVFSASADSMPPDLAAALHQWAASAQALQYEAIATVYAYSAQVRLAQPMLALHSSTEHPAQFVFDRGQLGGPAGLLAFVVSASTAERDLVQSRVLTQAKQQLGITVQALQTVVEKRATFACTPALQRPMAKIAPGLVACGDYVAGPYPATLEGAVRSGIQAVQAL